MMNESVLKIVRVAVTGAAGQIGYALLFRIAAGEMFGPNVQVELSLLELESAVRSLTGVVMELEDGAFPLLKKINITTNPAVAFADADWALLIGSIPRKAGMERRDLLHVNARIFVQQGMALSETAKTTCKVLVVGNPCNTNAFITKEYAKRLDPQNIFAMTMLDHNRAVTQLAKRAGVGIRDISCMTIWGNHSSTQFPDFLHAKINNKLASEVILDDVWLKGEYLDIVQKRGTAIIGARGCSSAASAAQAILDSVKAVHSHTAQGDWFSMATVSDGSYGVPEGLVFGFPVCSDGNKCTIIKNLHHTEFAQNKIKLTLQELVEEKEQINTFL